VGTAPATSEPEASGVRDTARERKIATMLFADVVGFTAMNEEHDPELVSAVVSEAFERLAREVARYEGTLEKFAGDALLAVFGVPTSHEDDPERAVRAALEMQALVHDVGAGGAERPRARLRIGIETGQVLVDHARAAGQRDLFVTGDAVNTAARLQAAADPGTVIVGPSTYAASREVIDYDEHAALELKGKAAPVPTWRAVAVKARRGGLRAPLGLQSPLIGRDSEISLLKDTVDRMRGDRNPHLVTVLGAAGVGKSRLTWELEKYLDGLPDRYHWRKGRCYAYSGPTFGPVAEVVKADARIHDDDAPADAVEKLEARLSQLAIPDDQRRGIQAALQVVLGIGGSETQFARDELFESWRRYLGAVAGVAPLVLVIEDIHWADDGMLSFLELLARWGQGPLLILCLARHELLETRPAWGGGLANSATIMLEPLGAEANAALLDGLIEGGISPAMRARIVEVADGNPLFTEEIVRMLVDRGLLRHVDGRWQLAGPVEQIEVPGSVQAVLAARLDSLPADEKRIAQDASVVGRIFWDTVVAYLASGTRDLTEDLLKRLRLKDLVVPRLPSSLAEAAEYGFRHVLIRDVAYDSIPKRERAVLHRAIATWASHELADRADEYAELIATHLSAALAYEEELGPESERARELRRLTRDAAIRAGRRAEAMDQRAPAGRWYRLALELGRSLGDPAAEQARLAITYADAVWMSDDPLGRAQLLTTIADELEALAGHDADEGQRVAHLRAFASIALFDAGRVEEARSTLVAAIERLEDEPPTPGRAMLLGNLGWTYWRAGPAEDAVPLLRRAIEEATVSDDARTRRNAMHDLGIALDFIDGSPEGEELVESSFRLAREAGDRALEMRCYINLPAIRINRGRALDDILEMTAEGLRRARRGADYSSIGWLAGNLAESLLEAGRPREAIEAAAEAVVAAAHGSAKLAAHKRLMRARLLGLLGEVEEGEREKAEALSLGYDAEPQIGADPLLDDAWARWPREPRAAFEQLVRATEVTAMLARERGRALHWAARMALRLDDAEALDRLIAAHRETRTKAASGAVAARDRWVDGLGVDLAAVEAAAEELEALGYRFSAADAWADAGILAKGSGAGERAAKRATELYAAMGVFPPLGGAGDNT